MLKPPALQLHLGMVIYQGAPLILDYQVPSLLLLPLLVQLLGCAAC